MCLILLRFHFSGHVLISADFRQLELRILAHFSQDSKLISLINSEEDVFVRIADNCNSIKLDEVTFG
jgi:DNA polymerase I-like protein with 3'-5' exonuclease and polymerase domains